ncbi:MAG: zinc ribbon domain-containing protein [Promethearchaeota archaeon]
MEKSSQGLVNFANRSFSDILSEGFRLFINNYKTLILPLAFFQVILIVLDTLLLTDLKVYIDSIGINVVSLMENLLQDVALTPSEWNLISLFLLLSLVLLFLQNLIGAIVITVAMCSVSNYVFRKLMHENPSFSSSFRSAFNKKILIVIFIIGICLPFSSLLLYIPAIFVFTMFIFLIFTYNMEEIDKPISEARRIAKGASNKLKILGVFVFNFVIIFIFSFILNSIIDLLLNPSIVAFNYDIWLTTRNYGSLILYQILINLANILLAPLFICLITALFASLKAKRELGFHYPRKAYPVKEENALTLGIEGRFYCPYCGILIDRLERFCPRCGEDLSVLIK